MAFYTEQERKAKNATRLRTLYAVRMGRLLKLPCEVCGEAKVEAHHVDYTNPMLVVWLCRPHHHDAHRAVSSTLRRLSSGSYVIEPA